MIDPESILAKITRAKREISEAERDLERAVGEIQANPRAQKTTVSKVVQVAIGRLKSARTDLEGLEQIVESETR